MTIAKTKMASVLEAYESGMRADEIADRFGYASAETVRGIVGKARRAKIKVSRPQIPRAKPGRKAHKAEALPPVDHSRKPDYSNLSLTGLIFGDPARGRSAFDKKMAGTRND